MKMGIISKILANFEMVQGKSTIKLMKLFKVYVEVK